MKAIKLCLLAVILASLSICITALVSHGSLFKRRAQAHLSIGRANLGFSPRGRNPLVLQSSEENNIVPNETSDVLPPGVEPLELNDELKSSFMSYAMSTILGRALPDARDGLKPVHRRVLFAMHGLGLLPSSTYRKCARA